MAKINEIKASRSAVERLSKKFNIDPFNIEQAILDFQRLKNNIPQKDIFKYKSFDDILQRIITAKDSSKQQKKTAKNKFSSRRIFKFGPYQVYHPQTYGQSCVYAQGAKWCTASNDRSHWQKRQKQHTQLYYVRNTSIELGQPLSMIGVELIPIKNNAGNQYQVRIFDFNNKEEVYHSLQQVKQLPNEVKSFISKNYNKNFEQFQKNDFDQYDRFYNLTFN